MGPFEIDKDMLLSGIEFVRLPSISEERHSLHKSSSGSSGSSGSKVTSDQVGIKPLAHELNIRNEHRGEKSDSADRMMEEIFQIMVL